MKRWWLALAAVGVSALLVWGIALEPRWIEVSELRLNTNGSPAQTIAVLSDLHLNGIGARERKVLDLLTARRPDIVILLGDAVDGVDDLPDLERLLKELPPSRRYAILGNWEYSGGLDLTTLRNTYAKHGVQLLINDCHAGIVGLDDYTAGRPNFAAALARCEKSGGGSAPFLLLQHSPGFFEQPADRSADVALSLSGHTHGGQITLFGHALWTPPGSGPFVAGEYTTTLGRLYVSRGIGTSLIPMRIGARPELLFVEFR